MSQQNRFALLDDQQKHQGGRSHSHRMANSKKKHQNSRKNNRKTASLPIPIAIQEQRRLRSKFYYSYREVNNGNVENNSTLYVNTGVAHPHQIEEIFLEVIEQARNMPDIFGKNFECDVQVNLVRKHTGQYMAYAFIDLSNPAIYYALIGCEIDGRERVEYIPDPDWVPPEPSTTPKETKSNSWADLDDDDWVPPEPSTTPKETKSNSWADLDDDDWGIGEESFKPSAPKLRHELPPLLKLNDFKYDEQQKIYLKTDEDYGNVGISPAFITPGVNDDHDDCKLYVSDVPANDHDFLYAIFARYARTSSYYEDEKFFYPKIQIRKNNREEDATKQKYYAIVQYAHSYDTAFALIMLQKIRAKYNGEDIFMRVRYAFSHYRYRH
jgi:hypothetical protein